MHRKAWESEDRMSDPRKLILVKHSLPDVDPSQPASRWPLSDEGRLRCLPLADRLAEYQPAHLAASSEPKAIATAEIIAESLGTPFEIAEGLHEHDRSNEPFVEAEEFQAAVASFFDRPDELVMGRETASQAQMRFGDAVQRLLSRHATGSVVVVAHGTVISLYVARHAAVEPMPLWRRLGLPSFVVLSLPDLGMIDVVERVDADATHE
jgi:broad specificity phosphatase PhoE